MGDKEIEVINSIIKNFDISNVEIGFKKISDNTMIVKIDGKADNILLAYMLLGKHIFKATKPTKKHLELYQKIADYIIENSNNNN